MAAFQARRADCHEFGIIKRFLAITWLIIKHIRGYEIRVLFEHFLNRTPDKRMKQKGKIVIESTHGIHLLVLEEYIGQLDHEVLSTFYISNC